MMMRFLIANSRGLVRRFVVCAVLAASLAAVPVIHAGITVFVANLSDSGGGTLRQAILDVNDAQGGRILFSNLSGTIALASQLPDIRFATEVEAVLPSQLAISGGGVCRVLTVATGATCTIKNLRVINGLTRELPGGGGVLNYGSLTLYDCTFSGNMAVPVYQQPSASDKEHSGGAIYSVGALNILNSLIVSNTALGADGRGLGIGRGGGVYSEGFTVISNSSLLANVAKGGIGYNSSGQLARGADAFGGGIFLKNSSLILTSSTVASNLCEAGHGGPLAFGGGIAIESGSVSMTNCTISGNFSLRGFSSVGDAQGGNLRVSNGSAFLLSCTVVNGRADRGTQIASSSSVVQLQNTIIAGYARNFPEILGPFTSMGHNLFKSGVSNSAGSDLVGFEPLLGPLQTNGGFTLTHALQPGSPAIDAGTGAGLIFDQIGQSRTLDQAAYVNRADSDGTDIGALELVTPVAPAAATNYVMNTQDAGPGSLRQAIADANRARGGAVLFSNVTGTIFLSNDLSALGNGVVVQGPGRDVLTIDAGLHRVFSGVSNVISDLTIYHGFPAAVSGEFIILNCTFLDCRGAVETFFASTLSNCTFSGTIGGYSPVRTLGRTTVSSCTFSNNSKQVGGANGIGGAAVYVESGNVAIERSTFISNVATSVLFSTDGPVNGGAIYVNDGTVAITDCTFDSNRVLNARSAHLNDARGGAIYSQGSLNLSNCTFAGNEAVASSSFGFGGAVAVSQQTNYFVNCTFSDNHARSIGGAIYAGSVALYNCTITTNRADGWSAGGIFAHSDGDVSIMNCILSGNFLSQSINNDPKDGYGNMHSYGHNLIGRSNGMSGFVASDIIGVPALLGPLQNNGGRTLTHIPLAGSPAIDQGTISPLLFDQRGRRRTADIRSVPNALGGNGTDIGAVEVDQWMGDQVVARVGNNILLSFNSDTGMVYGVQRRSDIRFGAWFTLPGSVNGNGSSVTYVHTNGAGLPSRFYRVFEQP